MENSIGSVVMEILSYSRKKNILLYIKGLIAWVLDPVVVVPYLEYKTWRGDVREENLSVMCICAFVTGSGGSCPLILIT